MRDLKKSDPPPYWKAVFVALLGMGAEGAALAQSPGTPAAATVPVAAAPDADASRPVDILEYIVRGNSVLDARTIERAVTPFMGPRRTMKDIEGARDALLAVYQAKGFQSVYVDLPEQQVTEGIVFLQVNETRVGRVRVVGAQYNSPTEVREQVPALQEGIVPDFNQAQNELTALNRGGKRQVMPLVRQGALPGTMDVDLKVEDSSPWRYSFGLNNDYSADTKRLRTTASIGHDNLWQLGHSASISFYGTPEDFSQTKVWSGSYTAPLANSNWAIEASGYVSDSNVATLGGTDVLGKGHSVGVKATYSIPNAGDWWHTVSLGVDFKDSEEILRLGGFAGTPGSLQYAPLTFAYSGFTQTERSQYSLGLQLVTGTRSFFGYGSSVQEFDDKRFKASPSFTLLKADINGSYTFEGNSQVGFRLSGQLTDSPLVSGEQMSAGGLNTVRGYLSSESTGDFGLVGSLEWRTRVFDTSASFAPWLESWRAYVFADAAQLRLRSPLPQQDDSFPMASVGVGSSFRLGSNVSGRVDLGYPLRDGARTERHSPRLTFNVNASY
ncbi:MAG: ShlB/FhaC/HecB family hemolysin secretion/activation protein [Variovorax sp.]|nr:MAG: ShlB/FhaC/HecB family hemolysin secretion/activation protein [Variovorax sp.]